MKIPIGALKENKSSIFREAAEPSALDLDVGVMHFRHPLQIIAEAWKTGSDLTVHVHVEGNRNFTCSLCLEEFNNLFEKDFTLHYDIKGLESVTIDPELRDELILDHPIRILCKPDCRGLCLVCGVNKNLEKCQHAQS